MEAQAKGRSIAVVTHAGVLRTVLCRLLGYSKDDAWEQTKSHCSVARLNSHLGIAGTKGGET